MTRWMTPAQRGKAFGLLAAGWSLGMVARKLGVTKSAISKLRARGVRLGENKAVMGDMGKCGRKKLFSPEQNRWIKRKVEENPFLSPAQLKRIDEQRGWPMGLEMVKVRRIRESLQRQGLAAKRAARKPNLTPAMIQKRIDWCLAHQHMSEEDWMKVEFSDESTFYQIRNASKLVRRPKGERFNPRFTVKTVKHPASVMVWGCFDGRFWRASWLPGERCHHELRQVPGHADGEVVAHLQGKEDELVPAGLSPLPRLQVHQGVPFKQSHQGPALARKLSGSQPN